MLADNHRKQSKDEDSSCFVTREQYEAALAASTPEWDGRFPIPAGTDVEVYFDGDDCRVWTRFRVEFMAGDVVVLHDYRVDDVDAYKQRNLSFRPIRSEADKKREAAIANMDVVLLMVKDRSKTSNEIYDAIAAGKIPGVKLED